MALRLTPTLQISVPHPTRHHLRHCTHATAQFGNLQARNLPGGLVCATRSARLVSTRGMAESPGGTAAVVEEKLGVRIERGPSESRLQELGIRSWPKWGCPASKFPWTYDGKETCYLLQGKVKVYPEGSSEFVEFGAGDLVVFPKGMSCTWEVSEAVDKHYQFEY